MYWILNYFLSHTLVYDTWAQTNNKMYSSKWQRNFRTSIFNKNLKKIYLHNINTSHSYKLGLNQFSDMTNQQFRSVHSINNIIPQITTHCVGQIPPIDPLPPQVDWSSKYVSTPQNEGNCGSSWAFSALGSAQGFLAKSRSLLLQLSAQQLIDCSNKYGNFGCNGGVLDSALFYGIDIGYTTIKEYPYVGKVENCKYSQNMKTYSIHQCAPILMGIYKQFVQAVAVQPIAGAIDSDFPDFQHYSSGIFKGQCNTSIDYGVTIVGYDQTTTDKFWKVKASLGTSWGQQGFMRLQMSNQNGSGKCGIQEGGFIVTN